MEQRAHRSRVGRHLAVVVAGAELPSPSVGEELVVCRTAPERVEIHCHGGQAAVSAIIQSLSQLGCRKVDWSEVPEPPGETSLQRSARTALAAARTEPWQPCSWTSIKALCSVPWPRLPHGSNKVIRLRRLSALTNCCDIASSDST